MDCSFIPPPSSETDTSDELEIDHIELDGVKIEYIEVTPDIICDINGENLECPELLVTTDEIEDPLDDYEFCQFCLSTQLIDHKCVILSKICPLCLRDIFGSDDGFHHVVFKHMRIWHLELVEKNWVPCLDCSTFYPTVDNLFDHDCPGGNLRLLEQILDQNSNFEVYSNANFAYKIDQSTDMPFNEENDLYKYMDTAKLFMCKYCIMDFGSRKELRSHECVVDTRICKYCEKKINGTKGLRSNRFLFDHMRHHHPDQVQGYWVPCPKCRLYFPTLKQLRAHKSACKTGGSGYKKFVVSYALKNDPSYDKLETNKKKESRAKFERTSKMKEDEEIVHLLDGLEKEIGTDAEEKPKSYQRIPVTGDDQHVFPGFPSGGDLDLDELDAQLFDLDKN